MFPSRKACSIVYRIIAFNFLRLRSNARLSWIINSNKNILISVFLPLYYVTVWVSTTLCFCFSLRLVNHHVVTGCLLLYSIPHTIYDYPPLPQPPISLFIHLYSLIFYLLYTRREGSKVLWNAVVFLWPNSIYTESSVTFEYVILVWKQGWTKYVPLRDF